MLKRLLRVILGVAAGVAILVAAVWVLSLTLGMREKLYQGQTVLYWQDACLSTNSAERSRAIALMNSEIIPDLTNTMFHDWDDSKFRVELIRWLNELPGVEIQYVSAPGRRGGAASDIGEFGPLASAAVPALIQALNGSDQPVRRHAAIALGRIHTEPDVVIPLLIPYLSDPDLTEAAILGLGGFGPAAKPAVPELLALFPGTDRDLQKALSSALQAIDPDTYTRVVLELESRQDEAERASASHAADLTNSPAVLNPAQ
jgi:hypothetical protein